MTTREEISVELDRTDQARLLQDVKAFDRELVKATVRRIRTVAGPIGKRMIQEVAPQTPRAGGLAYRIAGATGIVSTRIGSASGVSLSFRKPVVLEDIDKGSFSHPDHATGPRSGWRWSPQSIRAGMVTEAFNRNEATARAAVERAVLDTLRTIRSGEARP